MEISTGSTKKEVPTTSLPGVATSRNREWITQRTHPTSTIHPLHQAGKKITGPADIAGRQWRAPLHIYRRIIPYPRYHSWKGATWAGQAAADTPELAANHIWCCKNFRVGKQIFKAHAISTDGNQIYVSISQFKNFCAVNKGISIGEVMLIWYYSYMWYFFEDKIIYQNTLEKLHPNNVTKCKIWISYTVIEIYRGEISNYVTQPMEYPLLQMFVMSKLKFNLLSIRNFPDSKKSISEPFIETFLCWISSFFLLVNNMQFV